MKTYSEPISGATSVYRTRLNTACYGALVPALLLACLMLALLLQQEFAAALLLLPFFWLMYYFFSGFCAVFTLSDHSLHICYPYRLRERRYEFKLDKIIRLERHSFYRNEWFQLLYLSPEFKLTEYSISFELPYEDSEQLLKELRQRQINIRENCENIAESLSK